VVPMCGCRDGCEVLDPIISHDGETCVVCELPIVSINIDRLLGIEGMVRDLITNMRGTEFSEAAEIIAAEYAAEWLDQSDIVVEAVPQDLIEALAAYAHDAWSGWMAYLFSKSTQNTDGTATIPEWAVKRWGRQASTEYVGLPEDEKKSDRAEARKMLALMPPPAVPQAVRELVEKWTDEYEEGERVGDMDGKAGMGCANELAAAIAQADSQHTAATPNTSSQHSEETK